MSGECEKCGEHALECKCGPLSWRDENGWINVKDEYPTKAGFYLVVDEWMDIVEKAEFDGIDRWNVWFTPTHWMPLPQPPSCIA